MPLPETTVPLPETTVPELPAIELSPARKKLFYRSWYRGNKEMDNLLGHYAQARLPDMMEVGLGVYADLLAENDIDLWRWLSGQDPVPPEYTALMEDIQAFQQSRFA